MDYEVVYQSHGNVIALLLKENNTAIDLAAVTAMSLTLAGRAVESTNSSTQAITWAKAGYATGEVRISLGTLTTLVSGKYDAPLIVYDPTYTNGLVWGDIPIVIKSEIEGSTS